MDVGNILKQTIEDRPLLIELIKTVTPNLGKVLTGEAKEDILTKSEKKILRIYDDLDDEDLKTLIDYYAFMKKPIVTKGEEAEISDEPHPSDIASKVSEEEDQGAVGGIEPPPSYEDVVRGQNDFIDYLNEIPESERDQNTTKIYEENNKLFINNVEVKIGTGSITIGNNKYPLNPSLVSLLINKKPEIDMDYISETMRDYPKILKDVGLTTKVKKYKDLKDLWENKDKYDISKGKQICNFR